MTATETVQKVAAKIKLFNECNRHGHTGLGIYFRQSRASPRRNCEECAMSSISFHISCHCPQLPIHLFMQIYKRTILDSEFFGLWEAPTISGKINLWFYPYWWPMHLNILLRDRNVLMGQLQRPVSPGRSYRGNRAACQVILQRQTPGEARARPGCSSGRDERNPRGEGGHAVYSVKRNPEGGCGT